VNVIMTNSDNSSSNENRECEMQESIVDQDFSKLLANVRT
jgi:hypothetical protein